MPRLVATDLDGTLVRSDGTVSQRSHDVLSRLSAAGVTIVGITGRGPRLLELCRRDVPSAHWLVLAQGGFIYGANGRGPMTPWRSTLMPGARAAEVVAHVERGVGPLTVLVENDSSHEAPLMGDVIADWPFPVPIIAAERHVAFAGDAVKAFLRSDAIPAVELLPVARGLVPLDWCAMTEAGIGFVEVCPPGVDKGAGLSYVAQRAGVSLSDTLVFGDALNDLPMFAVAGRRVAMAAAHPQVTAAADEVTSGNDDDGVAEYLERLFE